MMRAACPTLFCVSCLHYQVSRTRWGKGRACILNRARAASWDGSKEESKERKALVEIMGLARLFFIFSAILAACRETAAFQNSHEKANLVSYRHNYFYPSSAVYKEEQEGLSYDLYDSSCPQLLPIVKRWVNFNVGRNPGLAASFLHLLFLDCFVQGCDASILLEMPDTEQNAPPIANALRKSTLDIIDSIKANVENECPSLVSCADIVVLAAREGLHQVGGPWVHLPLGRRDSFYAGDNRTVMMNILSPSSNFSSLRFLFSTKGLEIKDLVALLGAHTIGRTRCKSIESKISPTISSDLDKTYASKLKVMCLPSSGFDPNQFMPLDVQTPHIFDNAYFQLLLARKIPFQSDVTLLEDQEAVDLAIKYAFSQEEFFTQFSDSFAKLSQIGVLKSTNEGEIRKTCKIPNEA